MRALPPRRTMSATERHCGGPVEVVMEYRITMRAEPVDVEVIDEALRAIDPAGLVDLDGDRLRVATCLHVAELASLIGAAGYPIDDNQLIQLPPTCCGGCSG
jgi:hypothetical protein